MRTKEIDRRPRRRRPSAVAAASLLTAVVLASCGGAGGPLEVSVAQLREKPDVYVGDEISSTGRIAKVQIAGQPAYVLEDGQGEAILVEPRSKASRAVGEEVRVGGVFVVDLGGRPLLRVEMIDPAGTE